MKNEKFYSNGKLLLTGEYVVLDGASALAIPTQFGQSLCIEPISGSKLIWQSFDEHNNIWFEDTFSFGDITHKITHHHNTVSNELTKILHATTKLNPLFLDSNQGLSIKTYRDFPVNWGLGTSSTLINNIANWAKVDAYQLLELTFGGSGYDIACAQHNNPIVYKIHNGKRIINEVDFNPEFKDSLYFVHLNKKQNSREGIAQYNMNKDLSNSIIQDTSELTLKCITSESLEEFEELIQHHETIISNIIKQKPIKDLLFNDFSGSIKSLGAWGGDFILATSKKDPSPYFKSKSFGTVIPYTDMILSPYKKPHNL